MDLNGFPPPQYTFVKSGWPVGEVNPSATPEYA